MTLTENEIDDRTAFAQGDEFANEAEVRDYFTVEAMVEMFGRDPDYAPPSQGELDAWADAVIANRWHMEPLPTVAVEFAVCNETIRTRAIDDLIGLEHPNAAEACAAYHRAATQSLIDDKRASRLTVESPRGQRILHSQWAGAYFKYSAGAIGTMGELTDAEKAAVSAADDAGREAAQKIVDDAEVGETYGGTYYVRNAGDPVHLTAEDLKTLLAAVMTGMNAVGGKPPKSVCESLDTLVAKLEDASGLGIGKWPEWN